MTRAWLGRLAVVVIAALVVNVALTVLAVEHDTVLITLLVVAVIAAGVVALEALEPTDRLPWTVSFPEARRDTGEDTRTAMYRHVVEVHLTSREADDTIVWQIADLATRRMRQVHGVRPLDEPQRAQELLGLVLAEWTSHDRRHRYEPDARHRRYSVPELGDAITRIEQL